MKQREQQFSRKRLDFTFWCDSGEVAGGIGENMRKNWLCYSTVESPPRPLFFPVGHAPVYSGIIQENVRKQFGIHDIHSVSSYPARVDINLCVRRL